jgi:hypothetical protein
MKNDKFSRTLAIGQGLFYTITGFYPLFSRETFEKVTGPKHDFWLVNTVGVVIGSIGLTMISAGYNRRITPEIRGIGMGTAAGLTAIDIVYVSKKRISPVYLLDAAAETFLIFSWLYHHVSSGGQRFK